VTSTIDAIGAASEAVETALRHSAISVVEMDSPERAQQAAELLRIVWQDDGYPVPSNLLLTIQHAGGYLFGAYDADGSLLGVSMGLLSKDGLHSHITGVAAQARRRGLGYALKQHQRLWALDHGITTITWTCDPLVRRNVIFNLHALGAGIHEYGQDHYGAMTDGVNRGDESDRFLFHWSLLSSEAIRAGRERLPYAPPGNRPRALSADDAGPVVHDVAGVARLVATPPDIESLRASDQDQARAWRFAVRAAVQPALAAGGRIIGVTAAGDLAIDAPTTHVETGVER
jgi:predicted GNAT superfamily acetyltransferase